MNLHVHPLVAEALAARRPVVALESTVIAHGLPRPRNLEVARAMEARVAEEGAVPATLALLDGEVCIGLDGDRLARLAELEPAGVLKASTRDLASAIAHRRSAATTVAATCVLADRAGIHFFATGGLGGVHPGGEHSLDVSADLHAVARSRIAVVSAGAKAILDLGRTLQVLETLGVPVLGFGTDEFPAFYSRFSGLSLDHRFDTVSDLAAAIAAHWALGLSGVVVANPPPSGAAIPQDEVADWIHTAESEAKMARVSGARLTPWLLGRLAELSGGRTVDANAELLLDNATLAARLAVAHGELQRGS